MAIVSIVTFRRRASRRMVRDLPSDLAEMEWDEPLQVMVQVREMVARDQARDRGKIAPDQKAHWGVPSGPPSSRLRSADGLESFHFARNQTTGRTAGGFDAYSTKQKARDAEAGVQHGEELSDDLGRDQRAAAAFDGYVRDHGGETADGPYFITNLDPRPDKRSEQWDLIEEHERSKRTTPEGGAPRINLRYELAPELLLAAARRNDCPAALRDTILAERERVAAGRALPKRQQRDGTPWIDPDAERAIHWLEAQPGWEEWRDQKRKPAKLSRGRGTPTVWAGELELPHILGPDERRAVLHGLAEFVQDAAAADIEQQRARDREAGDPAADTRIWIVPTTIGEHVPGRLNHRLNFHAHPQFGRRIVAVESDGKLRFGDQKLQAMANMGWDKTLRCEAARLINLQLEVVGADYRLSPGTYAKMLIDAAPMSVKVHKATALENAGVVVDSAISNHVEGWRRQFAKAEEQQASAMLQLESRDGGYAGRIGVRSGEEPHELEERRAAARQFAEGALALMREAAELDVFIAMATSRVERVRTFADAYADETARKAGHETYDASRWRARRQEATRELVRLDAELADERLQRRLRQHEAARLQEQANTLYQLLDEQLEAERPANHVSIASAASVLSPHKAAELIRASPLLLRREGDQYEVRPEDDPESKLTGVDFKGPTIARRLSSIHAAQQKELSQIAAYGRKHGVARLRKLADAGEGDEWLARTARKWRGTPWMARFEDERRRINLAAGHRAWFADQHERDSKSPIQSDGPPGSLPDKAPDVPGGASSLTSEALARHGIVFAPAAADDRSDVASQPAMPVITIERLVPSAVVPSVPSVQPKLAAPAWTDQELRLKRSVSWQKEVAANHAEHNVETALASWARDGTDPSPLSARLLARVLAGFDPDRATATVHAARERDAADAADIRVLRRDERFAEWTARARGQDPALSATVARITAPQFKPDQFGRVPLEGDRLNFAFRLRPGDERPHMLSPREWALQTIKRLREADQLDDLVLSRRDRADDVVGLASSSLMAASRYNWIGMLYPDVQAELDAAARVKQERENAVVAKLWSGEATLRTELNERPFDRSISTEVRLSGLSQEETRLASTRALDRGFYVLCRAAELREGAEPGPLRHADATVRALLRAREEGASRSIVELLRARVEAKKATMNNDEVAVLTALMKQRTKIVASLPIDGKAKGRRRRPAPDQGRRSPER